MRELYNYAATVKRIIDGDTYELVVDLGFKINFTEKFRLLGADTPEIFGRKATPEGKKAKKFVQQLLKKQPKPLLIKTKKDRKGKYGRYLVDIQLECDENGEQFLLPVQLSNYLIDQGYAE